MTSVTVLYHYPLWVTRPRPTTLIIFYLLIYKMSSLHPTLNTGKKSLLPGRQLLLLQLRLWPLPWVGAEAVLLPVPCHVCTPYLTPSTFTPPPISSPCSVLAGSILAAVWDMEHGSSPALKYLCPCSMPQAIAGMKFSRAE